MKQGVMPNFEPRDLTTYLEKILALVAGGAME